MNWYRRFSSLDGIHSEFPLSSEVMEGIKKDVLSLYPESVGISIVGTYSRANEPISKDKEHDIDVLIRFPAMDIYDQLKIKNRDDSLLWKKWSPVFKKPVIDFLMRFGEEEPGYGSHRDRREMGLATPEVVIWKKQ